MRKSVLSWGSCETLRGKRPVCQFGNNACLHRKRVDFLRIYFQILDRLRDSAHLDFALLCQRVESGDNGTFGVDLEEAAQVFARVAAAEAIRAESRQSAGNPWCDLVGHELDVVRYRYEHAILTFQERLQIGFSW